MSKYAKVPVIMQMEALECGAASLTMILAHHGKWLPLETVRKDCGVSRDGSSAKNLLKAARNYGMTAKGFRCETSSLGQMKMPCILHWGFNHFVVLCGFHKDRAVINDPARGTVKVTREELDREFTGVVLTFEPTDAFQKGGKPRSILPFARERLRGTAGAIAFIVLTTVITAIIDLVYPAFGQVFMDRLLPGENPTWLMPFLGLMVLVVAIQAVVSLVQTIYLSRVEGKLAIVSSASFMWHVLRLPVEFFSQRMAGDIAQRQESNEGIAATLIKQLGPVLIDLVMLVLYLAIMLRYSVVLTLICVCSIAVNIALNQIILRKRLNISRVRMRDSGKLYGATVAGIEMIETIKASGAENGYFERWAGFSASVNAADVQAARMGRFWNALPGLVRSLSEIAILMIGVVLIIQGQFTVGMLMAFQSFMHSFMVPVNELLNVSKSVQEMKSSMERVEDVLAYEPDVTFAEPQPEEEAPAPAQEDADDFDLAFGGDSDYAKLTGEVEMRNVTFGYSRLAEPLIRDFSMTLRPGSRVAFVGASGCGKSTLAKLISGLYKPWSGEILFDGKPMSEISREVFTGSLAVVDQDITLYEDTIANNIKMWDSSIEDFEMILAARDAQIHEDIMLREGGYHHRLLEGGRDFSGGQRQRFEIARVLAQDPTIVVMDEATSALDAKTEYNVVEAIRNRGVTCIIIAHRLSTIRDCDEIIVLDRGVVVERGTHEELMALGGYYTTLVTTE
ncbi:MAG: NHLP family bacteriocin export ABC transporter peptidase/permease/ATPase subunit [Clostridiales bacterium]|nr:NHLP family bacteriocin export ABC transporter peptidase/permease/ATPase subunit [Clostridiales bacterium]